MDIVKVARDFAIECHKVQVRKYTGNPYSDHLEEVAKIVSLTSKNVEIATATAWLHDCVEDQNVSFETLKSIFSNFECGFQVVAGVKYLTEPNIKDRKIRKAEYRNQLKDAPDWVQSVKCADMLSNVPSIKEHDPKFAKLYVQECRDMCYTLVGSDALLRKLLHGML